MTTMSLSRRRVAEARRMRQTHGRKVRLLSHLPHPAWNVSPFRALASEDSFPILSNQTAAAIVVPTAHRPLMEAAVMVDVRSGLLMARPQARDVSFFHRRGL